MIVIPSFLGEIPRLNPRFLPQGFAARAQNARLTNGALQPFRQAVEAASLGATAATIYLYNGTWLSWAARTHVVPAPIDTDRIYYTTVGDTPKMRVAAGTIYELTLAAPAAAPTLTVNGSLDADLEEIIGYAYTFVTSLDEESPPSAISTLVSFSPGQNVDITGFSAPPASRGVDRIRIYRTQTSAAGITDLYYVTEQPIATTTWNHDLSAVPLGTPITTTDYDAPPADLDGLVAMANGILAGFSGKTVRFSEPYIPHAWPLKYALTVDHDIVGLAAFGSTLAVMTNSNPYLIQGSTPSNFVQQRIEEHLPCLSANAIADFGYAAAYPSHRGLVRISDSGLSVVSQRLFSEEDWRRLTPSSFIATNYEGNYVFVYNLTADGGEVIYDAGAAGEDYTSLETYDGEGPGVTADGILAFDFGDTETILGERQMAQIDLTGEQPFFIRLEGNVAGTPVTLYLDEPTGNLFIGTTTDTIEQFDAALGGVGTYRWLSAEFWSSAPISYPAILVQSDDDPAAFSLSVRVYADGTLIDTDTVYGQPRRLPGGFLANRWSVELVGSAEVSRVILADSFEELGMVA